MSAALRVLREELWWNRRARRNARLELRNPAVPQGLVALQMVKLDEEARELLDAIELIEARTDDHGEGSLELFPEGDHHVESRPC